jgi:tetratricopeptide (TPR) repeat protein
MKKTILILLICFPALLFGQRSQDDALAQQYFQNGEYEKALVLFQKLFDQRDGYRYYDNYFNTLLKLRKYEEAEKLSKRMMKAYGVSATYRIDYGRVLQEQGQQDKAEAWYNQQIRELPKEESAIRDLAMAFYRAAAYDYSVKAFLEGRKLLGNETLFTYDLISIYRFQKNKPMLVQEYLNMITGSTEPTIQLQARGVFSSLFEGSEDYDILKAALLKRLQKDPKNSELTDLLAWQYLQQKEFDLALRQVVALDKRQKEEGDRVFDLVSMLLSNNAYPTAIEGLEYLLTKGQGNRYYVPAKIQILNTKNQMLTSGKFSPEELRQLEKDYLALLSEFGRSARTVFAMRQLASLQAFYLGRPADAAKTLEEVIDMSGLPPVTVGQVKIDLGDIYILTGEIWEAAIMYGQAEKDFANEPIGQEARFKNAKLSYYRGDFAWAKTQLDVLKSSTSQLIANDALNLSLLIQENSSSKTDTDALKKYAAADLLLFSKQYDKALVTLDSITTLFPQNSLEDDILMLKSTVYLRKGETQKAIEQLEKIVSNFSYDLWADDAVFKLGDIYETVIKDNEKARGYYQKIISDYPGSLHITEARKRFRLLRGDSI